MSELMTKQEYEEKENELVKSVIEFAMSTKNFKENRCYTKEFVKVGDTEVTLLVMDESWIAMPKDNLYELISMTERRTRFELETEKKTNDEPKIKRSWKNLFGLKKGEINENT